MPLVSPEPPADALRAFQRELARSLAHRPSVDLVLPLPLFRLTLPALDASEDPLGQLRGPATLWRGLLRDPDGFFALATVALDPDDGWVLEEVRTDALVGAVSKVLQEREAHHQHAPGAGELRWLELPELGIEALWLHGGVAEAMVPFTGVRGLARGKPLPPPLFLLAVLDAALAWKAHDDRPPPLPKRRGAGDVE